MLGTSPSRGKANVDSFPDSYDVFISRKEDTVETLLDMVIYPIYHKSCRA